MVQVKKLGDAGKGKKPEAAIVDSNDAPVPLIGSKSNAVASPVKIPAFMQRSTMPEIGERELTGYIGFASDRSKNYPTMLASGVQNGDIYLFHKGQYLKVPQLDFFLVTGESFKSLMDNVGKFTYATRDLSAKTVERMVNTKNGPKAQSFDLSPHYVCLCIVNLNGKLIPIKGDFIGTKSGGIEQAIAAVTAASDPKSGWMRLSERHTQTAMFPEPFGRVYHSMRTKGEVSKSTGNPYHRTITVSNPADATQMQSLIDHLNTEEFNATLEEAHRNYQARIAFMDEVIANDGQK